MWMNNARWWWHDSCNGKITAGVSVVGHILERNRASTDTDWGVFSWPWQLFALGKNNPHLFVTSNRRIPVKNTLWYSAYVLFAYKTIRLFSVLFCVVRALHEILTWRLVINETPNKWQDGKEGMAVILMFLTGSIHFPLTVVTTVRGLYPRYAGQLHSLEQRTSHELHINHTSRCPWTSRNNNSCTWSPFQLDYRNYTSF